MERICCMPENEMPYNRAWKARHAVNHVLTYGTVDARTFANLMRPAREGCCETWPKPCPYHEGMTDALEILSELRETTTTTSRQ